MLSSATTKKLFSPFVVAVPEKIFSLIFLYIYIILVLIIYKHTCTNAGVTDSQTLKSYRPQRFVFIFFTRVLGGQTACSTMRQYIN